jgi:hypothetical protein
MADDILGTPNPKCATALACSFSFNETKKGVQVMPSLEPGIQAPKHGK